MKREHECSVTVESRPGARLIEPAQCDSDGQRKLGRTFEPARLGFDQQARWARHERRDQVAVEIAGSRDWDDASEVVMQHAALIGRIARAVVVAIAATVVGVMMVNVIGDADRSKVVSNITLGLGDVLQVNVNQRHKASHLCEKQQARKPRADMPPGRSHHHLINGPAYPDRYQGHARRTIANVISKSFVARVGIDGQPVVVFARR
jgi:hypothetical protein